MAAPLSVEVTSSPGAANSAPVTRTAEGRLQSGPRVSGVLTQPVAQVENIKKIPRGNSLGAPRLEPEVKEVDTGVTVTSPDVQNAKESPLLCDDNLESRKRDSVNEEAGDEATFSLSDQDKDDTQ
ncbi:hypothetical protein E8E12_002341 [Didymella heteroderae]|uniref:Uncharacterized protein n=1 Tax=Didymella heteroderae TaxID=1769908 RepID=A0A9P4WIZ4_9PLEO|nr:hypothetical protein E8E12_002341 [Didymella heteroderae]